MHHAGERHGYRYAYSMFSSNLCAEIDVIKEELRQARRLKELEEEMSRIRETT